jgi:hypothetical protein
MHEAYCQASGFVLPLDLAREMQWWEVYRRGIRAGDITALIRFMKWKKGKDLPVRSLVFRSFVGNPDYMEEDLAELRARQRSAPARQTDRSDRAAVLRSSGREPVPAPPAAKTAEQILEEQRLLNADFEEFKRKLAKGEV